VVLLLKRLAVTRDLIVRIKVVGALARVGSRFSLSELDRLARDPEPAVSRLAAFGGSVVAYRLGLPGHEVPVPAPDNFLKVERDRLAPVLVGRTGPEETRITLAGLRHDSFGLNLTTQVGFRIDCGVTRLFLTLSEEFVRRGVAGVLKQPMLLGLVAQRAPSDGTYSVRMVLLAGPQDKGKFHISVHRTDGTQMMFGSGTADDLQGRFELQSLRGRGNMAAILRGVVHGSEIVITEAGSSQLMSGQSAPKPLTS